MQLKNDNFSIEITPLKMHLNNYFDFHVRLSIRPFRPSVPSVPSVRSVRPVQKTSEFSAVLSQNVTKKSCLVSDKSEKYAFWITLTPQLDRCCRGEAEVRIINFKTTWSEFQMPSPTAPAEAKPRCV